MELIKLTILILHLIHIKTFKKGKAMYKQEREQMFNILQQKMLKFQW